MMPSKYWIKLYHEIIDDPKMGRLTDRLFRRVIELFLIAGEYDREGYLPSVEDIAWRLHLGIEEFETDLADLATLGIVQMTPDGWIVTNFAKRQAPVTGAERVRQHRQTKRKEKHGSNEPVTERYTDTDTDTDTDILKDDKNPIRELVVAWVELFPDKPKPQESTKSYRAKVKTRWKSKHFQDNWQKALECAALSPALQAESWFTFEFFIRNDENYQRCLNGFMDWKNEEYKHKQKEIAPSQDGSINV